MRASWSTSLALKLNQWLIINQLVILLTSAQRPSYSSRDSYFGHYLSSAPSSAHPYFPPDPYPNPLDTPWSSTIDHGYSTHGYRSPYSPLTPTPNGGQPPTPPNFQPPPPENGQTPSSAPQAIARCDCRAEVSAAEERMMKEMMDANGQEEEEEELEQTENGVQTPESGQLRRVGRSKSRSTPISKGSLEFICSRLQDKRSDRLDKERLIDQRTPTLSERRASKLIVQEKSAKFRDADDDYRNILPPPTTTRPVTQTPSQEEEEDDDSQDEIDRRNDERRDIDRRQDEQESESLSRLRNKNRKSSKTSKVRNSKLVISSKGLTETINLRNDDADDDIDKVLAKIRLDRRQRQQTKSSRQRKEKKKSKKNRIKLDDFALKG